MWELDDLQQLRLAELSEVLAILAEERFASGSILEIGAGSGWQSKSLADRGYDVRAIDVAESNYSSSGVFPVQQYDGKRIPFPDESFDIVFSSNVLEHIAWVDQFQNEISRVLKPGGISVHLVPTSSWRLWTTLLHYVFVVKYSLSLLSRKTVGENETRIASASERGHAVARQSSRIGLLRTAVFTRRHGEVGNCLTEQYYFSRYRWNALFAKTGWQRIRRTGNNLAYTGHGIFGGRLRLETRRRLSHFFGSSCHLYFMRREGNAVNSSERRVISASIAK
jgi:2-polyprenyl-3-methyl-5-hydroxy-6-metoxy-1,4-benzoquinol methylase